MHAGIAFLIGVIVTIAVLLILAAVAGTTYFGLAIQAEAILAATFLVIALIMVLIFYKAVQAQFRRVKTGKEALIGSKGIATTDIKPKGEIRVMGEFWEATAKDATIAAGQAVEVVSMEGVYLVVKPVEQKA